MAQIFLSYSRADAAAAKTVAGALGEAGHQVWWDKHIQGGSKFAAEIEEALDAAEIVIVLWSKSAVESAWVLDEAAEGRDSGRLLPVALDGCKPPLGFRQFQTIAAGGAGLDGAVEEILESVARKTGAEPSAKPAKRGAGGRCAAARSLAEQGRFEDAWREIEAALQDDPRSAEANREAGRLLHMQGRAADAIAYLEKAAAASKIDHASPAMLISCHRAVGDDDAMHRAAAVAFARAEQAVASDAMGGAAFASGARALAALGHRDRARKWVRKALNVCPGDLAMRYNLASTLARFFDDGDAAIDVLEPFAESACNRAQLQLLEGDPDWDGLRETRDFQTLLGRVRKRVEALEVTGGAGKRGAA